MSIKQLALCLAVVTACGGTAAANAQANRTFVSNIGTSNSQCSASSPCASFVSALSVTNSGGEINCLNAGNFGAVTINIPVTINCEGPSNGGVFVTTGTGITVTATGTVNLIGLDIDGIQMAGTGININGAANVVIRNCKIHGFASQGLELQAGTLLVDKSVIVENNTGIYEFDASGNLNMSVRNSNVSYNSNAGIRIVVSGGSHAGATIEQTTLAFNGDGVSLTGGVAIIGGSTIVNNSTGVSNSGGAVYSFKNNQIGGNNTNGTPLTAYPGGPLN